MGGGGRDGSSLARRIRAGAPGSRATRLELFYDLVFVFAFLNVTTLTAEDLTGAALLRGLVVLALLWWCWTGFATLGNTVRTDQGIIPLIGFVTMAAIFVLALAIPEAFIDRPGGLPGPLVFACCYFLVRAMQVLVFWEAVRYEPAARRGWWLAAVPVLIATALILTAALLPQRLTDGPTEGHVRIGLWMAALAVEYAAGAFGRTAGWTLLSAGHWAERHALIVLVALGESIISIGIGANLTTALPITWPVILAAGFGIAVIATLWWVYFDVVSLAAEQALHRTRDRDRRLRLAREGYTYLHLPMIAGIIGFALGLKRMLADIADPTQPLWGQPLGRLDVTVLYGGVALYLLALIGLAGRALRQVPRSATVAVAGIAALGPAAGGLPSLAALGLLAAVSVALVVRQLLRPNAPRGQIRQTAFDEQLAAEAEQSQWRRRHL